MIDINLWFSPELNFTMYMMEHSTYLYCTFCSPACPSTKYPSTGEYEPLSLYNMWIIYLGRVNITARRVAPYTPTRSPRFLCRLTAYMDLL